MNSIKQLSNNNSIKQLSNNNSIKRLSNNNSIKQLSNNNSIKQLSSNNLPRMSPIEQNIDIKETINSIKDIPINNLTQLSSSIGESNTFNFKSFIIKFCLFLFILIILGIIIYAIYYYLILNNLNDLDMFLKKTYHQITKFFESLNIFKSNNLDKIKKISDKTSHENTIDLSNNNQTDNQNKEIENQNKEIENQNKQIENQNKQIDNQKNNEKNLLKETINYAVNNSKKIQNNIKLPDAIESEFQKSGYCFIGNLNDVRYCSEVSAKNKCMSGDIFPSMDLCINPNIK